MGESTENLIDELRNLRAELDGTNGANTIEQAIERIVVLEDEADFIMADKLSDAVAKVIKKTIVRESGVDSAFLQALMVSNDGFEGSVLDGSPNGYLWVFTGKRQARDE